MEDKIKIKMLKNVRPEFLFLAKPGTILRQGMEYDAISNQHGAISGLCANGEYLGVRPGEFEFVTAPEWVLAIHKGRTDDVSVCYDCADLGDDGLCMSPGSCRKDNDDYWE